MRGIIMINRRIIFLSIMSFICIPMFAIQGNIDRIIRAAKTGDLATIQTLDPDGANQAITNGEEWKELGVTPLFIAAIMVNSL